MFGPDGINRFIFNVDLSQIQSLCFSADIDKSREAKTAPEAGNAMKITGSLFMTIKTGYSCPWE
jgi:hypothetical protein